MLGELDKSMLAIDYNKSVPEIYSEVTTYLLKQLPLLTVLSLVERNHERVSPQLATWIPDFSTDLPGNRRNRFGYWNSRTGRLYNAAVIDLSGPSGRSLHQNILRVKGHFLGQIVDQSKPTKSRAVIEDIKRLLHAHSVLPARYSNGQGRLEALWWTLLGDYDAVSTECPVTVDLTQNFMTWVLLVLNSGEDRDSEAYQQILALTLELADEPRGTFRQV